MKRIVKCLACLFLAFALLNGEAATVMATTSDYYDLGFMKFNGVYVNKWGQTIPGVKRRGIDVSSYQGSIDWSQVAQDDVSFAFIRCGFTKTGPDTLYDYNVSNALANGIDCGIYYVSWAPNEQVARMEADYAVNCAKKYNITLPIVYDVEGKTMASLGANQVKKNVNAFCEEVKACGYTPMIYTNVSFKKDYIGNTSYDMWIARYADQCDYTGSKRYWQCSSHGLVKGISGCVDIDFEY